jgi:selenocysteine lyase/cysteine desulfurase
MMQRRKFLRRAAGAGLTALAAETLGGCSRRPVDGAANQMPAPSDPGFWRWVREQFSVPAGEAYFNVGTLGSRPRVVIDAVANHMREIESTIAHYDYRPEHPEYIAGYRKQEELRAKLGSLMNVNGREIALLQNATMGSSFIAAGLDLSPGDEVLLTDQEHQGNRGGWELREKRGGIVVRKLPLGSPPADPDAVVAVFKEAIGPRTKVIDVPHITSKLGIVMPVQRICEMAKARGVFTLIDGAQALGHIRVDVKAIGCDAYVTSPHKWLLAPVGTGVLWVAEDRLKDVWATLASGNWNNYDPADGAFRLMQFGTANLSLLAGLDAAIAFHENIGPARIQQRILELANRLRDGLGKIDRAEIHSAKHPSMTCGIVTWGIQGVTGPALMDELWTRKKIRVRSQDDKMVRQSSHFYNSADEIDATLEVARALAKA